MRASYLVSVIPEWLQNTKKSRRNYCDPSVQRKKSWPNGIGCVSALYRQKEKDFKISPEVLFLIAHRFCCPCTLLYIARKGMYARETLVGFPLHVKSPARRRPLLRSKSAAPKRKTPVGVSFFLEQGTGIEPASSAWEADVLPMY